MKRFIIITLMAVMLFILSACQSNSTPEVTPQTHNNNAGETMEGVMAVNVWARPSMPAQGNGAVYLTLMNHTKQDDVLLSVESPVAEAAELHESKMEGDVMKMTPVEHITLPAGGMVKFKPGSLHVMLVNLNEPLKPGDKIPLTFNFETAGPIEITAEVTEEDNMQMEHNEDMEHSEMNHDE